MTKEEMEERRNQWKERVAAFKESGQSMNAWCKVNVLKVYQLRYWLEKYDPVEKEVLDSQWISVEIDQKPETKDNVLTIKIDQATIEVKPGFDPILLRDVVKALNVTC